MDTVTEGAGGPAVEPDPDDADAGEPQGPGSARHYSTGKLSVAQARVLDGWRRQLGVADRRWTTSDRRPAASSSDCLAAAVVDLLDRAEPGHLELIRYAARLRSAQLTARGRPAPGIPTASFYLGADYADRLDDLLAAAYSHHCELVETGRTVELAIPHRPYKLPAGTVARWAIDRWARRSPAAVVADAVDYARTHHQQLHRARADMTVTSPHAT